PNGTLSAVSSSDGGITWTATFTPAAGITDATNVVTLNNAGVQDAAGNAGAGSTDSNNYSVDTQRPTATVVVADTSLIAGETSLVTITMSEAVANFDNADLSVANGNLSNVVTSDGGITWTATFTPTAGITDTTNVITFDSTGVIDGAGNIGAGPISSNNYTIDTARPVATIVVADAALAVGETSLVTITFSEAVTGFTNADLTVDSGTLSAVSSSDGGVTWTATFTPTAGITDSTNVIILDSTGVTDAAGNVGAGAIGSNNYAIDLLRPAATIAVADTSITAGETSLVTFTFSESVTNFTNADVTVSNGTLSAVSSSDGGITWTATLTPTANITDTTNIITLNNGGVQDLAGNPGIGTTDSNNYEVDTTRPTATIIVADTLLTAGETSAVTFTFSKPVTGLTAADLAVANGAVSNLNSSDGGITWTGTLTPSTGVTDTSNVITLNNTGVQDLSGNMGIGTTDSNNYAMDTARPTATALVRVDSSPTNASTVSYTAIFSEDVTGVDVSDFTLNTTYYSSATIAGVAAVDAHTYTVTLSDVKGGGTVRIDLNSTGTGITDAAGNALNTGLMGDSYTIAAVSPDILHAGKAPAPLPLTPDVHVVSSVPSQSLPLQSLSSIDNGVELISMGSSPMASIHVLPISHNAVIDSNGSFGMTLPWLISNNISNWTIVELRGADGTLPPSWLHYDVVSGTLQGVPPANYSGTLHIEIVATDSRGHHVIGEVELNFGEKPQRADSVIDKADKPQKHVVKPAAAKASLDAQFKQHARHAAFNSKVAHPAQHVAEALHRKADIKSVISLSSRT
ncbi:MAG TPA: Ig-like domain-containing protein, partial [Steroidobacteraceae bacterium]|nr:Ig-like domain-containing protein [Steroidobacteraceae bacterium]